MFQQSSLDSFVKVASTDDISEGEMKGYQVEGVDILLAQVGGKYYAINDICSHFFTLLSSGYLYTEECEVQCPLHDSRFSLATGEPNAPPADKPVDAYDVRVEGSDIFVGPRQTA
jgi:naphthalene 1,2-dioxygenase system ferredoxin subunit